MNKYDKIMKKVYKKYNMVAKEELWNFNRNIFRWFAPRVRAFYEKSKDVIAWTIKERDELIRLAELSELLSNEFLDIKWEDVKHLVLSKKNRALGKKPNEACDDDLWAEQRCMEEWKTLFCNNLGKLWW